MALEASQLGDGRGDASGVGMATLFNRQSGTGRMTGGSRS